MNGLRSFLFLAAYDKQEFNINKGVCFVSSFGYSSETRLLSHRNTEISYNMAHKWPHYKKKVYVRNESPIYLVEMSLNTPNESNYIIFLIIIQHHIALQL